MRFSSERSQNRIASHIDTSQPRSYNKSLYEHWILCVFCVATLVACGRKGPPLAPIVYVPRPVTELTAKRVEDEVVLQFKIPTANTDSSSPADLEQIEVYAHTGPLPAPADFYKYGTLVHRLEVKEPPRESGNEEKDEGGAERGADGRPASAEATRGSVPSSDTGLVEQGWAVSVRERLTEKHMEIGPMPPTRPAPLAAVPIETLETPGTVNFPAPVSRFYTVVGVSRSRNRKGPHAGPIRIPLVSPLQPPETIEATYTADAISLSWPRLPEDSVAPIAADTKVADKMEAEHSDQETEGTFEIYADVETPGTRDAPWPGVAAPPRAAPAPAPRFGYNVYDASAAAPSAEPAADGAREPVLPLNAALLTAPTYSDPRVEFGTERCYVVRRVELVAAVPIESAPSPPVCVTPVDKFAPAPPKSLVSVATTSSVSLIWDANTEADFGGYLVLRGEAPGDTLAPLTEAPITDAAYVDASVRRNRTYVYEIVAVDKAGNQSASSNRVEETIR